MLLYNLDLHALSNLLTEWGEPAYERALKILEKFLPPDHPNIRIVRGNLESL